jgi:pimeloyl-ACP methyl ester carboxylesterase
MWNLVISNVPGPQFPLYMAGARLEANYPISVVTDGMGLNMTVMSYLGSLDFGIVADREQIPDAWDLMGWLGEALDELRPAGRAPETADEEPAPEFCDVGREITLCYEEFGAAEDPPLLLIMGLATQMIAWPDEFCEGLAGRGFHVVRFDNRDVGRSTHTAGRPPTAGEMVRRRVPPGSYTLSDMAADAVGLLRALGLEPAHVVGASMGGMIAQTVAAEHPESVRSLVSIMSNTGSRLRGQPALGIYRYFLRRAPAGREPYIEHVMAVFRVIGSPGFPADEARTRDLIARSYDRDHDPEGPGRQLAAIWASGDRTEALRLITAPTLVIHGTADKMVRKSGGRATARAIPGARLELIRGMGHDLPAALWPRLIDLIAGHAQAADRAAPAAATTAQ